MSNYARCPNEACPTNTAVVEPFEDRPAVNARVLDVQRNRDSLRRRRECTSCGKRFSTLEQCGEPAKTNAKAIALLRSLQLQVGAILAENSST